MRLILVIDVAEDVAENYKDFTVDYDLRGTPIDDDKVNESIKYVEDVDVRPLPTECSDSTEIYNAHGEIDCYQLTEYARGWNACIDAITGETE